MKYAIIAATLLTFSVTAAEQAVMSEVQIVGHSGGMVTVESTGMAWGPDQVDDTAAELERVKNEYQHLEDICFESWEDEAEEVAELRAQNKQLQDIIWHLVIIMDDDAEQK